MHQLEKIPFTSIQVWQPYILAISTLLLFVFGIDGTDILSQGDEYMHIATVRESLENGTFLLPQLEGIPNYYKPPILFWIGMLSESILGHSLFAVRFPAVLAGFGSVLSLFHLLKYLKINAFLPAIAYALTLGSMKFSRLLMMEQFMAFAFILTTYLFIRYMRSQNKRWLLAAGLVSATGYFFKGPLFQIYTGFLFLAWAIPLILHFNHLGKYRGHINFHKVIVAGIVLHIPLILPLIWNLWLFFGSHQEYGRSMLKFFFINENLSKFSHENQSVGLIFLGWVIYTMPWTIVICGSFVYALQKENRTFNSRAGKIMMLTAISISLLHLIPSRKDPYYIIPVLPLLIGSLPLILESESFKIKLNKIIQANLVFSGLISFISLAIGITLHLNILLILILSLAPIFHLFLLYTGNNEKFKAHIWLIHARLISGGASAMLSLQFIVLPALSLPMVPENLRGNLANKICIISEEPWDGFALKMILPQNKIKHHFPGSKISCNNTDTGIIYLSEIKPQINTNMKLISSWKRWKHNPPNSDFIKAFGKLDAIQTNASYYEIQSKQKANEDN